MTSKSNSHLSFLDKAGYGSASAGDSLIYGLTGMFMMFFLTTVAGIQPAVAGFMSAIGSIYSMVFYPVMGYVSDQFRSKYGRRRPLLIVSAIPFGLFTFLLFTNVDMPPGAKAVYYTIIMVILWTWYGVFYVPYTAMGTLYTTDSDAQAKLRLYASFFNMTGVAISMITPTLLASMFEKAGMTTDQSWSLVGAIIGTCAAVAVMVSGLASKKFDKGCSTKIATLKSADSKTNKLNPVSMIKEYIEVVKIKPMISLIIASFLPLIGYSILMSDIIYFLTYNCMVTAAVASLFLVMRPCISACLIPLVSKLIEATDKRETLLIFYGVGSAGLIAFKFITPDCIPLIVIYIFFATVLTCIYWQVVVMLFYDVCEYDRIINGRNREGAIVSFQGLIDSCAEGIGVWILGIVLQFSGFNGEALAQSATALTWIHNCATWLPVIFFVAGGLVLMKYPLSRKYMAKLQNQEIQNQERGRL
ncbi:MAG: MFS transporter [Firmicutes bacterium]|nr:MFS transporter [Bacillota bacterium]